MERIPDGRRDPAPAPARMWFALLRRLGRGVTGRRVTVQDAAFTPVALDGRPDGASWSRARDVHLVLADVVTPELTARELVVECDTLTVGSTVTATGVTVTATMTADEVRALGDDDTAVPEFEVVDGELRSHWFPGVDVVVRPEVAPDRLRFVPLALLTPAGRWSSPLLLPPWLPAVTGPPPELPGGLRLVDIATVDDVLVLRCAVDRWTASVSDRRHQPVDIVAPRRPGEP